ncbi:hypothetical protein C2S52_023379 [Perilla frutescens var. hirtella]|nr:hypothetical protein C2S52_023379 [Perilla frutescens var. hirtella]
MDIWNAIRSLKDIYGKWDVRGLMLISLFLQTALLLMAPLRQRTSNKWLLGTLLCLYLLADWAANFAAGVISSSDFTKKKGQPLAFWSTFLLVHLGGPDSITAFAMQDNDFWHRHAMAIAFQCCSATYIFFQTLAENQLLIPTLLMFVSGVIRYSERTRSLYLASLNTLRNSLRNPADPGPRYEEAMDAYRGHRESGLPTRIERIHVPPKLPYVEKGVLGKREAVLHAHRFFQTFRRLIVDVKCSHRERVRSRQFFLSRTAEDAFQVLALEQNFMYGILFTKAITVYNLGGYCLRAFSFSLVVASSILFYFKEKKSQHFSDVAISYTLLGGAIAFDAIGFIQLIASNWLVASTHKLPVVKLRSGDEEKAPRMWKLVQRRLWKLVQRRLWKLVAGIWCESVSEHSLIEYCVSPRRAEKQAIMDWFGIGEFFDGLKYVRRTEFTGGLRDHIFAEVKIKSDFAEDCKTAKETSEARGNWTLLMERHCRHLLPYVQDVDYDQSLLTWHIATEICLCVCVAGGAAAGDDHKAVDDQENKHREFSKRLSRYMLYLVTNQPAIMHGVTDIGQTRLRDTIAEIRRANDDEYPGHKKPSTFQVISYALRSTFLLLTLPFILPLFIVICVPLLPDPLIQKLRKLVMVQFLGWGDKKTEEGLCRKIYSVNTEVAPVGIKGYRSKSVLYDGCRLAKELMELDEHRKWEVMSRVWVEMLSYAAVHARPQALAEQWSQGGELITFVWLLMAHFGLADVFEDCEGEIRAKLSFGK